MARNQAITFNEARQERRDILGATEASLLNTQSHAPNPMIRGIYQGDDLIRDRGGVIKVYVVQAIVSITSLPQLRVIVELIETAGMESG